MLVLLLCVLVVPTVCLSPRHVHIYYANDKTSMGVDYVTDDTSGECEFPTQVRYGTSPAKLDNSVEGSVFYMKDVGCLHQALMTNLQSDTQYTYAPGWEGCPFNRTFNFTNWPTKRSPHYAMFADLGLVNDKSYPQLKNDALQNSIDYVIHAGDFAYNFEDANSTVGNKFMQLMEPIFSHIPYQVAPGNHEEWHNFTQYKNRFSGFGKMYPTHTPLYYSFDIDLVHWLAIDTETWAEYPDKGLQDSLINFIDEDLSKVDRSKTPWIVCFGHKAWYMANWTFIEPLLFKYGVDLYITGHVHNYMRFYPLYAGGHLGMFHAKVDTDSVSADGHTYFDPKYMTTIVAGSAGCDEGIAKECGPSKKLIPKNFPKFLENCWFEYGLGYLQVPNATHLYWKWVEQPNGNGESKTGKEDHVWIIKEPIKKLI